MKPDIEVDSAALPHGWEGMNHRLSRRDQPRREHPNLVRAHVAAGLIPEHRIGLELRFADHLEERERE